MKIYDCFIYYDEDFILDLRLNILNNFVDKFVIVEADYDHQGKKKKRNFDINNFKAFKNKIIYKCIDKFPDDLDSSGRENYQRNYIFNCLKEVHEDDLILLSDIDEIPDLRKFNYHSFYKYYFFEQKFFYYKLNLLNITRPIWYGSRICKKRFLRSPQWFRNLKPRRDANLRYPFWRIDKLRYKYIKNGGWHFSFLKDPSGIKQKIQSFCHAEYNKEAYTNINHISSCILEHKDIFNRKFCFKKISIGKDFPDYITQNISKFQLWIDK